MTLTEIILAVTLTTAMSAGTIQMSKRTTNEVSTLNDIHKQADAYHLDAMKIAFGPDYNPENPTGQPQ